MSKNQTLEINPAHPIIVNLNYLRKQDAALASVVSKQMLDNVLLQSGVPFDTNAAIKSSYLMLEKVLDAHLGDEPTGTRKLKAEEEGNGESVLKKSQRDLKRDGARRVIKEINVNEQHFK